MAMKRKDNVLHHILLYDGTPTFFCEFRPISVFLFLILTFFCEFRPMLFCRSCGVFHLFLPLTIYDNAPQISGFF